jgi:hypothetical protein
VAGRDRDRRARARAAREVARVEHVAARAVGRSRADEAGRELIHVGLAEAQRAGRE